MLILKERTFALEVSCFKPAVSLVFVESGEEVVDSFIFWDLVTFIMPRRRIDIGWIGENSSNFALFE